MFDVIVIGARCGGSPTAMLLARNGHRVLLVDRATFPSDTMSTHFVHPPGLARLTSWGLLDGLMATGCPPVTRMSFDVGPFSLVGSAPGVAGIAFAAAPRRTVLDSLLAEAAVSSGVELRESFTVNELTTDGEQATGIRGKDRDGRAVAESARLVVGADGLHSIVARTVDAPIYEDRGALTCAAYAYWEGDPLEGAELYPRGDRFIIAFPTHDGLTVVVVMVAAAQAHSFRRNLEHNYLDTLDLVPGLAARVRGGHREGHIVSTADLPNRFRRPYGPGWALVGDASYHEDPLIAHGISNAFRDAELLAHAIDAGLSGREPLDRALAGYEQRRNEAAMPIFELGCQLSTLGPPSPEMLQLLTALNGNQVEIDRFWGAIQGTVPVADFFGRDSVARIIETAA